MFIGQSGEHLLKTKIVLRTGLEGTMVSLEFSAAGSPTPRGAGLGFNF
jgi:hypothetical protein